MLFSLEIAIVIALFACGCWSARVAVISLPVIAVSLIVFAIRFGNPLGLLVSGGGWIIQDTILVIAVVIGNITSWVRKAL